MGGCCLEGPRVRNLSRQGRMLCVNVSLGQACIQAELCYGNAYTFLCSSLCCCLLGAESQAVNCEMFAVWLCFALLLIVTDLVFADSHVHQRTRVLSHRNHTLGQTCLLPQARKRAHTVRELLIMVRMFATPCIESNFW